MHSLVLLARFRRAMMRSSLRLVVAIWFYLIVSGLIQRCIPLAFEIESGIVSCLIAGVVPVPIGYHLIKPAVFCVVLRGVNGHSHAEGITGPHLVSDDIERLILCE